MSLKDPREVLGVAPDASEEEVRRAWLDAVKSHPPDRDPEGFRRIQAAFDELKTPESRWERRLFGDPAIRGFTDLSLRLETKRVHVGPGPWRDALREGGR